MNTLKCVVCGMIGLFVSVSHGADPLTLCGNDLLVEREAATRNSAIRENRSNLVLDPEKAIVFPYGSVYGRNLFAVEDGIILTTGQLMPTLSPGPAVIFEFQMINQDNKNRTNPQIRSLFNLDYRFDSLIQVGPDAYLAIKYYSINEGQRHFVLLNSRGVTEDVVTINFDVSRFDSPNISNYLKFQTVNGRHFLTDSLGSVKMVEYDASKRKVSFRALEVPQNLLSKPVIIKSATSDGIVAIGRYDLPIVWKAQSGEFKLQPTESYPVYDVLFKFVENGDRINFNRRAQTITINPGTTREIKIATADFLPENAFVNQDGFYVILGNEINKADPRFRKTLLLVVDPTGLSYKVNLPKADYVKFDNVILHSNGTLIGTVYTNPLVGFELGAYQMGDVVSYKFAPDMRSVRETDLVKVSDVSSSSIAQIKELPNGNLMITQSYDSPVIIVPLVEKK